MLARPVRRRSRNSSRVACMPTPTTSAGSRAAARSSAASSVVAEVSKRSGRMPIRSKFSVTLRGASRSTSTTTSRALRSTPPLGRSSVPPVTTTTSGRCPALASASAPWSTPMSTGRCSRTKALIPRSSASQPWERTTTTTGRPAIDVCVRGTPWPWSSRSCSRRRNSVLLWVKLSSWAARPLRAAVISLRTSSGVSSRAVATRVSPACTTPAWIRTPAPSLSRSKTSVPALSTTTTPASTRSWGRGWRSGRRSSVRR